MSIKVLPDEVVQQIKSSVVITALNTVICGLVKNSLDAGANTVNVSLDYSRGNCSVEDDGLGVLPAEFREGGGLGKLHHTSRYHSASTVNYHGRNGDFLASLAALSLITIASHHHQHHSHNSITLHNSKILSRNTPASPEQRLLTFDHGTRVTVRDLFGSMAVRVKQRAAASEKAAVDREWGRLVRDVVGLLLAWPVGVSVSLRDSIHHNEIRLRTNLKASTGDAALVSRASRILAHSGLADADDHDSWVSVGASAGNISIDGCLSLNPVATRRAQFISVGIQPVTNESGSNVLYDEINRVFDQSSFALDEDAADSEENLVGKTSPFKSAGFTGRELRSRRSLERWPMFYTRITLARQSSYRTSSVDDVLDNSGRTLSEIIELLKVVCYEFLKKHHFRPRAANPSVRKSTGLDINAPTVKDLRGRTSDNPPKTSSNGRKSRSQTTTPVPRPDSPFDFWQRVKVGKVAQELPKRAPLAFQIPGSASSADTKSRNQAPTTIGQLQHSIRLVDRSGNLTRRPFDVPNPRIEETRWKSPPTQLQTATPHAPHILEAPTVIEGAQEADSVSQNTIGTLYESVSGELAVSLQTTLPTRIWLDKNRQGNRETSKQLSDLIPAWKNPVFEPTEPAVPRINHDHNPGVGSNVGRGVCAHISTSVGLDVSTVSLQGRLSKNALSEAEVISQVDKKFILVKLRLELAKQVESVADRDDSNTVMVIIDQHAADERCRLESLMRDYFPGIGEHPAKARTQMLDRPLRFELSMKEASLLRRFSKHFEYWGISYQLEPDSRHDSDSHAKVLLISLPPSILERCKQEPKLVTDLLRNEIWKLDEEGGSRSKPIEAVNGRHGFEHAWVSNFQGCPQGILDMLNSRSCRSAIMFNDPLSHDQCTSLLQELAECAFPFQCAHGRPSMVPLVDFHNFRTNVAMEERGTGSFGSRINNWP